MRPTGTTAELERRRLRAVEAVREGRGPAAVAAVLGVDRSTIYRWLRMADQPAGVRAVPRHYQPRLADDRLPELERLLARGARAHGWANDLWTAARVAELVRRHFGVEYHPEHVRKVLKRRLGWTSQKPQRRARERDEWGIRWWLLATFPAVAERAAARGAYLVFLDESGYQLAPTVRRTFAPRGRTPVLDCWDRRDKISAISCVTLSPGRRKPGLFFELLPDKENVKAADVVAFLEKLRSRLRRLTVVWDRNGIHARSKAVREYLAAHPAVEAEDFPGYAPELNPDELVWGWTKYGRLANYAAEDLGALRGAVQGELEWLQRHPYALLDFINHTPLRLTG